MMSWLFLMRSMRAGCGAAALAWTTQPMTCDVGMCCAVTPPGSTVLSCRPAASPGRPSKNHHAVHGDQHNRLRAHERAHSGRDSRHCRALDRDDHQVLNAQACRVVAGVDRRAVFGTVGIHPDEATLAQGTQRLAARHGRQLNLPGRQTRTQPAGEQATDGTDANDSDFLNGRCCAHAR
jgi:hypothetical protein